MLKTVNQFIYVLVFISGSYFELRAQSFSLFEPDFSEAIQIEGMELVWQDEFNIDGRPNIQFWSFEKGFVRNNELQWYKEENAFCENGRLIIEGRKEQIRNSNFKANSENWKFNRAFAEYTSSSINTRGKKEWKYGSFIIRARIDTTRGAWPAIWTLGVEKRWPENGEIDIMEYYIRNDEPSILANAAWKNEITVWDDAIIPFSKFLKKDPDWVRKFHIWRMDWDAYSINLYLDDELLNTIDVEKTKNKEGFTPFNNPHYLLLNLAIGSNGGDPSKSNFPITYEIDYVRVYQKK